FSSDDNDEIENLPSVVYPNPVRADEVYITNTDSDEEFRLFDMQGRLIPFLEKQFDETSGRSRLKIPPTTATGIYILNWKDRSELLLIKD
ncbi:MAG: T9SS type A sorting domain-containing protein, partial [Flavobacteriaceae bacterium]|nr:T9SS type A sorting domain-containing protein [Flavobacteriaceae bacterium]